MKLEMCDKFPITTCLFLQLFQRCLMKVLNIDLWKCYLSYVKETKQNMPNFRFVIIN